MTKYYYTCPIQALYMIKEFGVECAFDVSGLINDFKSFGKIYVAKESEHIFEPKEGDANEDFYFDGHKWVAYWDKNEWHQDIKLKIQLRDGKQFFYPLIEK